MDLPPVCPGVGGILCCFHLKSFVKLRKDDWLLLCDECCSDCYNQTEGIININDIQEDASTASHLSLARLRARCEEFLPDYQIRLRHHESMFTSLSEAKQLVEEWERGFDDAWSRDERALDELLQHFKATEQRITSKALSKSMKSISTMHMRPKAKAKEMTKIQNTLVRMSQEIEKVREEYNILYQKTSIMDVLCTLPSVSHPAGKVLFYIATHDNKFFEKLYNIDCCINDFCAFDGANLLPCVIDAQRQPLMEVGCKLRVSSPVPFTAPRTKGVEIFASISHTGIFASFWYNNSLSLVEMVNLISSARIVLETEDFTGVAFYDDKVVLLTTHQPLREAQTTNLFAAPCTSTLEPIDTAPPLFFWTDVSLVHSRRAILYAGTDYVLAEYNVDNRCCIRCPKAPKVTEIASLTGIGIHPAAVFRAYDDKGGTHIVEDNGDTKDLLDISPSGGLALVLPSAANEKDLSRAVIVYDDGSIFTGGVAGGKITQPFKYSGIVSAVRIYRDVFALYNPEGQAWTMVRISVP